MQKSNASLRRLFFGGAALGALTLAIGAASAQTPEPQTPADTVSAPQGQEDGAKREKVVVTGSRIARDTFTSPSPITVITAESAQLEGLVDTAEILQGASISAGSVQLNNAFGGFVVEGGPGINSVSLRGLGAQRSLVLLNGQRPGPAGVRGQVGAFDLGVIPDSIISRIDILKDGASSVYGSDAVAGVANIITRTSVDKPELTFQYNQPFEEGGETYQINGAWGTDWGNGSLVLAAEWEKQEPIKFKDRDYLSCAQDYVFDSAGNRVDRLDNSVLEGTSLANCNNIYFNTVINGSSRYIPSPDGVTTGPIPGYRPRTNSSYTTSPTGYAYYEDVLNDPRFGETYAVAGVERVSLYGRTDVNLSAFGGIDWTTEALYTNRQYESRRVRQFFPVIAPNFAYDVPGTFGDAGDSVFSSSLAQPVTIWPSNTDVDLDYYYITTGFDGSFDVGNLFTNWAWSLDANYTRSEGTYENNSILAETAGDWNYASADGLYHGPNYDPFDPDFLSGNYSQEVYDLLSGHEVGSTTYDQTTITGVISGDLFELPAGPVGAAFGAEYRKFSINDVPSENSQNDMLWGQTSAGITKGTDHVGELFAEVEVPIVRGVPGFEEFTISGSTRWFDYDSYGRDSVWKAGFNWQVIPSVRFRGTQGTSYRAPALYELFLGNQTGFLGQTSIDPCIDWGTSTNDNIRANCAAAGVPDDYNGVGSSALITTGGGKGVLTAETSTAKTLGVIFTPSFIDLSIAVDYFDYEIEDAVTQLGAGTILGGCYGSPNYPNAFCNLFTRAPASHPTRAYQILTVNDSYLNANKQATHGIDYSIRYNHEFNFGRLTVDLNATQTNEDVNLLFDPAIASGFDTNDFNGSIGDPEWVGDAQVSLRRGDFTYSWFVDYIAATSNTVLGYSENITYQGLSDVYRIAHTDEYLTHDFSVRWRGDKFTITGGIANAFDAKPPILATGGGTRLGMIPNFGTQYDLRGRTGFLRVGYEF
ncbi:MAG: TonB-dependent receptor [Hyphomonadaceae bacterium]